MRKINQKLLDRLTKGDLLPLLNYVKSDDELRLEVRQKGDAFVYYRKGKALEIKNLRVDPKYGSVPPTSLAVTDPQQYFSLIKTSIDNWLNCKKQRGEFDTQQNVARHNQDINDKYLIIDMEYAFEQNQINKNIRVKRGVFDLLGIERATDRIVFFEVKKGLSAVPGKSGVDEHIRDFENHFIGSNSVFFVNNLVNDIINIIGDKSALGILNNYNIPNNFGDLTPELVFVFDPDNLSQIKQFKAVLKNRHKLIIVDKTNYKLL